MATSNKENYLTKAIESYGDDTVRLVAETELVRQMLEFCSVQPGADIIIQVKHSAGHCATARLYDHAALVQSLYECLEYFQSELV